MTDFTEIARPYAQAAFEYALANKQVPHWLKNLQLLKQVIHNPTLQRLLQDPKFTPAQRADAIIAIAEEKLDTPDRNFIKLLAEEDRLETLPEIADLFAKFQAENEKVMAVKVSSVIELSAEDKKQLAEKLSERFGYKVDLHCHLDPALIGGLVIQAGDTVIDNSVRGQFLRLQKELAVE